jgi:hypothetical protein
VSTRHTVAAAGAILALAPSAALAATPSKKLERAYKQAYAKAEHAKAHPGRNILADGVLVGSRGRRAATAAELRRSLGVLERMTAPAAAAAGGSTASPALEAIASCESGGDPTAVSPDGTYRGKYQFDYGTWASVGGTGDPAAAPEAEQDMRAAELYARSGSTPWPVCGG